MKVYGQLERAQIENVAALPTVGIAGRVVFLTTNSRFYYDDGSSWNILLSTGTTDTLDNKSLKDSTTFFIDNADPTKKMQFQIAGITTGVTRTLTVPDADVVLVGADNTQTLTNKTLTSPTLTTPTIDAALMTEGSAPSTPSAGTLKVYAKTDSKLYTKNSAGTESQVGAGAGGGSINYISANPDAESATTGWATYKDAAASTPVDGTGGAATLTFTRTTSSPLRGTASFLVTTTAANLQGEGASYAFTLDTADQAKVMSISFDYSIASGTYADGDMTCYIYDVTNSTVIQPAGYSISNIASGVAKQIATFQTSSNSTSYRLIFHRSVSTSSAMTMKIDNIVVGPQIVQYGAPVTDWQSYTPTGSWVSNTTYSGKWRRIGDTMELSVKILTSGAPTSASLTVNLPSGYTIDTTKINSAADTTPIGFGYAFDSGIRNYGISVSYNSTTSISAQNTEPGTGTNAVNQVTPFTFGASDYVELVSRVPIVGWSSTVQMSNDTDTRVVAADYGNTASSTIGTGVTTLPFNTKNFDTHGAFVTDTYTIAVSGKYRVSTIVSSAPVSLTTGQNLSIFLNKNGTAFAAEQINGNGTSTTYSGSISRTVDCLAGNTITVSASASVATTTNGSANYNSFSIERISGPSAIAASEVVACNYYNASAQSCSTGASTTLTNWTKVNDSHSFFNATTGVATIPVSGRYRISTNVLLASAAVTVGSNRFMQAELKGTKSKTFSTNAVWASITTYLTSGGSMTLDYLAGDTISIGCNNQSGSTIAINAGSTDTWVSIERIGN